MEKILGSVLVLAALYGAAEPAPRLAALIVDGQNNHDWKSTTPILKRILEETGLFTVAVATSPAQGQDMRQFKPDFSAYRLVISNYTGDDWPPETQRAFESYVRSGGGFVVYHAANNAFPAWVQYNEMIALGGWGGRNEKSGPYVRYRDGRFVLDDSPGVGGSHSKQHPFVITLRDRKHPITKGLPESWMHAQDELYDRMRGPAVNATFLATAFSDKAVGGTGEHEPMLITVRFGEGRVFHTMLGHGPDAMKSVDFIVTLQRGAEWAATGKVTQKVPADFPGPDKVSLRE